VDEREHLEGKASRTSRVIGASDRHTCVMSNEVDVFSGSKHESDARDFDTRGVTVFARKDVRRRTKADVAADLQ
jgi:hypothetical protein